MACASAIGESISSASSTIASSSTGASAGGASGETSSTAAGRSCLHHASTLPVILPRRTRTTMATRHLPCGGLNAHGRRNLPRSRPRRRATARRTRGSAHAPAGAPLDRPDPRRQLHGARWAPIQDFRYFAGVVVSDFPGFSAFAFDSVFTGAFFPTRARAFFTVFGFDSGFAPASSLAGEPEVAALSAGSAG